METLNWTLKGLDDNNPHHVEILIQRQFVSKKEPNRVFFSKLQLSAIENLFYKDCAHFLLESANVLKMLH